MAGTCKIIPKRVPGKFGKDPAEEQHGAGLARLSKVEFERCRKLDNKYKRRFEFPFIFAVKDAEKGRILAAFEARVDNNCETGFEVAPTQVKRIAQIRNEQRIAPPCH